MYTRPQLCKTTERNTHSNKGQKRNSELGLAPLARLELATHGLGIRCFTVSHVY